MRGSKKVCGRGRETNNQVCLALALPSVALSMPERLGWPSATLSMRLLLCYVCCPSHMATSMGLSRTLRQRYCLPTMQLCLARVHPNHSVIPQLGSAVPIFAPHGVHIYLLFYTRHPTVSILFVSKMLLI